MNKFWMVWNENGHAPTFKHHSEESARFEAERLARKDRGQVFHVLELKGSCKVVDVFWTNQRDDDMPF